MQDNIEVNIELLIEEMKKRPAFYDITCPKYYDRIHKRMLWQEVCLILHPGYAMFRKQDKMQFGKFLQKKWQSLRDCFRREVSILKKVEAGKMAKKKCIYKYYDALTFLLPFTNNEGCQETTIAAVNEWPSDSSDSHNVETQHSGRKRNHDDLFEELEINTAQMSEDVEAAEEYNNKTADVCDVKSYHLSRKRNRQHIIKEIELKTEQISEGEEEIEEDPTKTADVNKFETHYFICKKNSEYLNETEIELKPQGEEESEKNNNKTADVNDVVETNEFNHKRYGDDDEAFLLSLLPSFKEYTIDQKFLLRIEIMQTMLKFIKRAKYTDMRSSLP